MGAIATYCALCLISQWVFCANLSLYLRVTPIVHVLPAILEPLFEVGIERREWSLCIVHGVCCESAGYVV